MTSEGFRLTLICDHSRLLAFLQHTEYIKGMYDLDDQT